MDIDAPCKNTLDVERHPTGRWIKIMQPKTVVMGLVLSLISMVLLFRIGPSNFNFVTNFNFLPQQTLGHDKLFGGLLSPDFKNELCFSRYKSSIYRKPSPFPIPPYLIQRLRNYEEYHKKCGPGTENYRKATEQLKFGKSFEHVDCQYIVWLPQAGTGNRMLSLVSTFLFSLLTNRVMLVEMSNGMHELFCEPFPRSSWVLPNDSPFKDTTRFFFQKKRDTSRFNRDSPESYPLMVKKKKINNYVNVSAQSLPAYVYLPLLGGDKANHIFCENDQKILQKINWIILRSDLYYAVSFFLMPMYHEELEKSFPIKDSVFHIIGRYLLHPVNSVWGQIERYYEAYLANVDELIGLQIRLFPEYKVPFDKMFDRILECSRNVNLLPELGPTNMTDVAKKHKAILVTSLSAEYYERIKSMYYENSTVAGEKVAVYQASHEQIERNNDGPHNQKALIDIFLLSYSDKIAVTSLSTFGYVAYGLGGLRPWIIRSPGKMQDGLEGACVRPKSVDPCMHGSPVLKCNGNENIDAAQLVPFVRRCEDAWWGIKLFS